LIFDYEEYLAGWLASNIVEKEEIFQLQLKECS